MTEPQKLVRARQLKSILNTVSDVSMAFRELNQQLPFSKAKYENSLDELISLYEDLIKQLVNYLRSTEYGKRLDKTT